MNNSEYNSFSFLQENFSRIASLLNLDEGTQDFLRNTMREYSFSIPVHMDDGTLKVFRGFRIIHNDSRGPAKGGIRFHPHETIDTLRSLAMLMTWKSAVMDIPLGGAMGGVICDPHHLSLREQEQICRGWVRQMSQNMGPHTDIAAPDVMTTAQHMQWMLDEYEMMRGGRYPGFITGKPAGLGGSQGRIQSSGYGLIFAVREALKELNIRIQDASASIQGFGAVARYAAELFIKLGGTVTAVSCWNSDEMKSFTFRKKDGIKIEELVPITNIFGSIDTAKAKDLGYEILPGSSWLEQPVTVLIPSALENEITITNVSKIHVAVKLLAEGAHNPTTAEAENVLIEKGIFILPDLLANAGGLISSYFEYVQSNANFFWSQDEVLSRLDHTMTGAFIQLSEFKQKKKLTMRDAAHIVAVDRVAKACKSRGWV